MRYDSYDFRTALQRLGRNSEPASLQRRRRLQRNDFTIVSNNCWGAEVYKDLGVQFNTPFIGLFIGAPCFLRLAADFRRIVQSPMRFTRSSYKRVNEIQRSKPHPTGLLADSVEIHFLHYSSEAQALEKWNRRVARINFDRLFFAIAIDGDMPFTDAEVLAFDRGPSPRKVAFGKRAIEQVSSLVTMSNYVPDGKLLYNETLAVWDVISWLNQP